MMKWLRQFWPGQPTADPMPSSARVGHFIERFEGDLREAQTQEQRDNASGRLAYWKKVQTRG